MKHRMDEFIHHQPRCVAHAAYALLQHHLRKVLLGLVQTLHSPPQAVGAYGLGKTLTGPLLVPGEARGILRLGAV